MTKEVENKKIKVTSKSFEVGEPSPVAEPLIIGGFVIADYVVSPTTVVFEVNTYHHTRTFQDVTRNMPGFIKVDGAIFSQSAIHWIKGQETFKVSYGKAETEELEWVTEEDTQEYAK